MAFDFIPTLLGKATKNEVAVLVAGKGFDGWQSVSVSKSIEAIANQFSIGLFDRFEGLRTDWPLRPGVDVKVSIDGQRVITGRIEKLGVNYTSEDRSFIISGRSRAGDLVDCTHNGPFEYKNIFLNTLAEKLVEPFGIKVFVSVVPDIIEKFAVKPGETVFEALDRAARLQGFFFISTAKGNIRLTKVGAADARFRAFSSLEQDVNVLEATAEYDDTQRYKDYRVIGQAAGTDSFFGEDVARPKGAASDNGVKRHRPLTMIAEGSVDSAKAKKRAEWEASSRLAKAIRVTAKVQGWKQDNGSLWDINQTTNFRSKFLGLDRDLLIVGVTYNDGTDAGKTSDLTLVDPQAYNAQPVVNSKSSDDIFASLGSDF